MKKENEAKGARAFSSFSSFILPPEVRQHLAGEELHTAARQFMSDRAGLTAGENDADAELPRVMFELLTNRGGAAGDDEAAALEVGPGLLFGQEVLAIFQQGDGGRRRSVARRREQDAPEEVLDEVPEVRLEFLARL